LELECGEVKCVEVGECCAAEEEEEEEEDV
jgi:hypothetical protein